MKLDLKKLQEVSMQYQTQNLPGGVILDNSLSRNALDLMVSRVLTFEDTSYKLAPNNIQLAVNTLKELGILIETEPEKPKPQQLNS